MVQLMITIVIIVMSSMFMRSVEGCGMEAVDASRFAVTHVIGT
jgi:hypothetical protein